MSTQEKAGANVQWTSKAEDAKRIYAALKAFEGIPTEAIEAGAVQRLVEAATEMMKNFQFSDGARATPIDRNGEDAVNMKDVDRLEAALTPFQQKR
jgi:hypothetical protein